MKKRSDRIYIDNPGFQCDLKVTSTDINNVDVQLSVLNSFNETLYLWRLKLPAIYLSDWCIFIRDLDADKDLNYIGDGLGRKYPISQKDVIRFDPAQKILFNCNITKNYKFEKNKSYKIAYNAWMPLIGSNMDYVYKTDEGDDSEYPIFFLLESKWIFFNT